MTPIELTDEQRQAVRAQQGQPVEVIDLATGQHYVLFAREQYERVRWLLERGASARSLAPAAATAGPDGAEGQPMRVRIRELLTPPEVVAEAEQHCRKLGLTRRNLRQGIEDELKLQYYFGGKYVGFLRTEEGPVVVAAGRLDSAEFDRQLGALTEEERRRVMLDVPSVWNDTVSEILTPFAHEG
ncbi:MAG TPA: hypothetical protein VG013_18475 [Gemmataceae bacterium]|jgi:hypothetical protein|nr:hypothetical protein [Gemmataceae bacterium]